MLVCKLIVHNVKNPTIVMTVGFLLKQTYEICCGYRNSVMMYLNHHTICQLDSLVAFDVLSNNN